MEESNDNQLSIIGLLVWLHGNQFPFGGCLLVCWHEI